ncbi:PAS domain-containing methyl-accepting chemotaxis protein [Steroidobacter sp.]|uniref:methyl-accepting chemotaxis protein n=1 Tax=Steroidobacter sp. TaxID=1978227 RepID=UPI001A422114|nr:PAS domain-containing methyl-accepting chemotaxis protein [Steroidobacter sp.]MBL8266042.1 PAS domain-containing protein [Steroidobacter sp.]
MRNNGPVNQVEYVLPEGEVIITHTDTQSRITYANPAFLASSEFSLQECLGQPQNLVRHPDMPQEAFADLWATIKAGKSWTGIVKNRRKSGGFYWVRANVTPMMDGNGRIVGYMSVRVKPTRQEVESASRIYARILAGQAGSTRIRHGKVVDTSLAGLGSRLANMSLRTGTWWVLGGLSTLLSIMTVLSYLHGAGIVTWLSLIGAMATFANMFYVQNNVVKPLISLQRSTFRMLSGDTSTRIPVEGVSCVVAVASTLEQIRVKLDGVMKDNLHAAGEVRGSVEQVVQANEELARRTNEHAASLEETAASLEELTAAVARNTQNSVQATQLGRDSSVTTARGCEVVGDVRATMDEISASSKRIGEIVGIIDSIAFQTNLLALNAAVEAARAGDQGRGFAVVAQEVRHLAQRSASSAREIRELIQVSQQTVQRGTALATEAEESMRQVVAAVKKVTEVVSEIETASHEQAQGIEQINSAVTQMDSMTQDDARMAQELTGAAQMLEAQSDQMLAAISAFSIKTEHGHAVRPSSHAAAGREDIAIAA